MASPLNKPIDPNKADALSLEASPMKSTLRKKESDTSASDHVMDMLGTSPRKEVTIGSSSNSRRDSVASTNSRRDSFGSPRLRSSTKEGPSSIQDDVLDILMGESPSVKSSATMARRSPKTQVATAIASATTSMMEELSLSEDNDINLSEDYDEFGEAIDVEQYKQNQDDKVIPFNQNLIAADMDEVNSVENDDNDNFYLGGVTGSPKHENNSEMGSGTSLPGVGRDRDERDAYSSSLDTIEDNDFKTAAPNKNPIAESHEQTSSLITQGIEVIDTDAAFKLEFAVGDAKDSVQAMSTISDSSVNLTEDTLMGSAGMIGSTSSNSDKQSASTTFTKVEFATTEYYNADRFVDFNSLEAPNSIKGVDGLEIPHQDIINSDMSLADIQATESETTTTPAISTVNSVDLFEDVRTTPPLLKPRDNPVVSTQSSIKSSETLAAPLQNKTPPTESQLQREWQFKNGLPSDLSHMLITVSDPKTFGASPSSLMSPILDGHIRYKITRTIPSDPQLNPQYVRRRFRDFQALHLRLTHLYPHLVLPSLPQSRNLNLKPSEEFLVTRARRLEGYLVALLKTDQAIWGCPDLESFLLLDSESFDEIATKYLANNGRDLHVPPSAVSAVLSDSVSYLMRNFWSDPQKPGAAMYSVLNSSFKDLNAYEDEFGHSHQRSSSFERLTAAFENCVTAFQSRSRVSENMGSSINDFCSADEASALFVLAFNPSHDQQFCSAIIGSPQALEYETSPNGSLRSLHQCAAKLQGACDLHKRIVSADPSEQVSVDEESLSKQFSSLRTDATSALIQAANEFVNASLERSRAETMALKDIKQRLELL